MRSKSIVRYLTMTCLAAVAAATVLAAQEREVPRFLYDDPLTSDEDAAIDAGSVVRLELGSWADFVVNTFMSPGDRRAIPAVNVNTLGKVPDSSWFTNRVGSRAMTLDEIERGPDRVERLDIRDWLIVEGKPSGHQAGFRAVSAAAPDQVYQIEFDPIANPEMATGAEIIGTAIYHALGYNVVETYLVDVDPARLTIAPDATVEEAGSRRRFTHRDLSGILARAARQPNGAFRATASPFAEGRNLGPFKYYGTREGDPNDIYPHEHRRELRGNRVFAAWLNHDDSRAGNSLDMLVGPSGARYVKHYMFDFGSILGSGTSDPDHAWAGHEYVVEPRPALLTLASLGLWRRPFTRIDAPATMPAAGSFTANGYVPARWKPHFPNVAFANMQPEDAFWAAEILAAFPVEGLQRIVEKARFSDPQVADYITGTLVRRRELTLRTWLAAVNPISNVRIAEDGELQFDNVAVSAGIADPPDGYELAWFHFDNERDIRRYVATERAGSARRVPNALHGVEYAGVDIRLSGRTRPEWRKPVRVYFRNAGGQWITVGVERDAQSLEERNARR